MSRLDDIRNAAKASARQEGGSWQGSVSGAKVLEMPLPKDAYQAFGAPTKDPQMRLIIYAKKMFLMPRYDVLYDIAFSGRYDFVGLIYPHQRIHMHGRNLSPLLVELRTHSVEYVREYIPAIHELPEDDGTLTVIEDIQIEGASPFEEDLQGGNG